MSSRSKRGLAILAGLLLVLWLLSEQLKALFMNAEEKAIDVMASAIKKHEGWVPPGPGYPRGSVSYRNNNPGNLRVRGDKAPFTDDRGFGIFSTEAKGMEALKNDLRAKFRKYPGYSIYEIIARYAPPSENNTAAYAQVIGDALGLPIGTTLSEISQGA